MVLLISIKKRADFLKVKEINAARVVTSGVILSAAHTPDKRIENEPKLAQTARFGITVTKKISKLAVERNKIRRRLREVIKKTLSLYGLPAHDYVFIARDYALTREFAKLLRDVEGGIVEVNKKLVKLCEKSASD